MDNKKNNENKNNKKREQKNKYNAENITIGGMALFDGLILRHKYKECIACRENEDIEVVVTKSSNNKKENLIDKIPILRGIINLINTIKNSIPHIMKSVESMGNEILNMLDSEKKQNTEEDGDLEISKFEVVIGYIIAILIITTLFILIPNFLSEYLDYTYKNIFQFLVQFSIFIIYLLALGSNDKLKSIFQYHGAEHKVVNAYETLKEQYVNDNDKILQNLTTEEIKKASRFHLRCGGNLIMYYMLFNFLITLFVPSTDIIVKTMIQLVAFLLNIGIAFEVLILVSKLPKRCSVIGYPAMLIQFITTKEPSYEQIQVAMYCMKACIKEKLDITVKEYLNNYTGELKAKKIEYALNDILRVISFVSNNDTNNLFLNPENIYLEYNHQIKLDKLLNKIYIENIPLQYVLGKQKFYNEEYNVNSNVLIPRADSEILVEQALKYIEQENIEELVDMCTGSGCIGISIANNSKIVSKVFLVDISTRALEVTKTNIELNKVEQKCEIVTSNLFSAFKEKSILKNKKFKLIVSNPPYIASKEIKKLDKKVQNEPILALDGGDDGLLIYRQLFKEASEYLTNNGFLIIEIGYDQKEKIKEIIANSENYEYIECVKDLNMNDRVIICRFHQK